MFLCCPYVVLCVVIGIHYMRYLFPICIFVCVCVRRYLSVVFVAVLCYCYIVDLVCLCLSCLYFRSFQSNCRSYLLLFAMFLLYSQVSDLSSIT